MIITIEIDNMCGKIIDRLNIDQLAIIQQECQFKVEGADFKQYAFKNKRRGGFEWDGYKKLFNIQTRKFPIGLLDRVVNLFQKNGIKVNIVNKRKIIDTKYNYNYDATFLRDYQTDCVVKSMINGNGIVKVATGGGKTVIAGCTIGALGKKSIFIVHTRDLLYQAKESFQRLFPDETIGQIGDGIIDYQNITVATMQTLAILGGIDIGRNTYDEESSNDEAKIEADKAKKEAFHKYAATVQCVMMDEVQIVCSQTAYGVRFLFEYANYAFGYSASPWRDDGSDLMIEGAFGKRIVNITASYLIQHGYLVKPTIEVHETSYDTSNQPAKYVEVYKKFIVENSMRNIQVANDAIAEYNAGKNTLILVTQIKHGEELQNIMSAMGVPVNFISGKSGMKRRKQAIEDMRNGEIQILIATTIADVGLDIPRLESLIEAGAGKSSVTALQRLGRIMRIFEDKQTCKFITYSDNVKYLSDHIVRKLEIWSTEPEFIVVRKI